MSDKPLLTEGNILKRILVFVFPLLLGNLFQQLYNTADIIIVGHFIGLEAQAAVASSTGIINMLIGFFMGVATGASAIISQAFGAGDKKRLHNAIHSTFFLTLILGILFTIIGIIASPFILRLMKTPDNVIDSSIIYLRIYFLGIMGLMIYNMGAGVLRAVGDSKRPLYFLMISSVLNIILDIVFIIVFGMGIKGVAFATLIAQSVSAFLVIRLLIKSKESYRLILREIKAYPEVLKRILGIGLPGGFQQSVTAISNIIVQTYVNMFGEAAMAGYGVFLRIDSLLIMPAQSVSLGIVNFVGQNVGAGKIKRARDGVKISFLASFAFTIVGCTALFFFGEAILRLFTPDANAVYYGNLLVKGLMPLYFTLVTAIVYGGAMRGFGEGTTPMLVMTGGLVVLRQIYLFIAMKVSFSFETLVLCYPVSWIFAGGFMYLLYKKGSWLKKQQWILDAEKREKES